MCIYIKLENKLKTILCRVTSWKPYDPYKRCKRPLHRCRRPLHRKWVSLNKMTNFAEKN